MKITETVQSLRPSFRKEQWRKYALQFISILFLFFLLSLFASLLTDTEEVILLADTWGYLGVFIVAFVSGFNVIIPVPAIALLPLFTSAGLSKVGTILLISFGMTCGDFLGFLIGNTGNKLADSSKHRKRLVRLEKLREKNEWWPLIFLGCYASVAPVPNELVVIPIAFMGYPLRYVLPTVLIGNTIFNFLLAYGVFELLIGLVR